MPVQRISEAINVAMPFPACFDNQDEKLKKKKSNLKKIKLT